MAPQLYGRVFEIDLVRERMLRSVEEANPVGERRSVLVIEGAAASGKTALLDELSRQCVGNVPSAYVDLEAIEPALDDNPIPELLATMAFELSRRCKLYGSLRFDRLVIGLLAIQLPLSRLDATAARQQVVELLRQRRGLPTLKHVLGQVASQALALLPAPYAPSADLVTSAVEMGVDRLSTWSPTRRQTLGRFQDWYGHQDCERGLDPVDALMELNGANRNRPERNSRRDADEVLWRAFLADLRDNFRTTKHPEDWTLNALLLLDNADTQLGTDFLRRLVHAHPGGLDTATPLTVVASSRGGLLGTLTRAERATVHDVVDVPTAQPPGPRIQWLRRKLPAFTVEEIHELVQKLELPDGNHRNLASMLHQLAGGHPGGTYALLEAVASEGTAMVEPEELLRYEHGAGTLEDTLHDRLLAGVSENSLDLVTTYSAARHRTEALGMLNQHSGHNRTELAVLLAALWDSQPENHTTLLRLLLLRRLARRPGAWHAVHERLRENAARNGDLVGELHHMLSLGRIDEVVTTLAARLPQTTLPDPLTLPDWLALLDRVTIAPHKIGELSPDLTGTAGYIHTLIVGLWTASDPVCKSDRSALYWRIAQAYRELTAHLNNEAEGSEALLDVVDLIHRYEQLATRWRRMFRPPDSDRH